MPHSYPLYKESVRDWFLENVPLNTLILDVGAGCGTYSDLLSGYGYQMDAVEIWQPYIDKYELHKKYGVVYNENILNMALGYYEYYDFYILGDVLEHLTAEEGQWLMSFLRLKGKKYLVAVPYAMEQGEYEGNVHETHLQPDLTPQIMNERYPDLELIYGNEYYGYYINKKQKHEKAYVLYADNSYFDLLDACCRSIRNFSNYPIYAYLLNSDKKIDVPNTYTIKWECDVKHLKQRNEYIKREDKQIYKLLIERPKIVKHALVNFAKTVAYVDTDSIANSNVDDIFTYFNYGSDYPYFVQGIYDFLIINGRGGASNYDNLDNTLEAPVCELFKSDQKQRQHTGYRQTGYFVAGQNCIDFLELWYYRCNHPAIIKNNAWFAPYNEESVLQSCLYDYKATIGLPYCYINGLYKDLEYKNEEYFMGEWKKVPLKVNHFFWHGEKDINKINEFIKYLKA